MQSLQIISLDLINPGKKGNDTTTMDSTRRMFLTYEKTLFNNSGGHSMSYHKSIIAYAIGLVVFVMIAIFAILNLVGAFGP